MRINLERLFPVRAQRNHILAGCRFCRAFRSDMDDGRLVGVVDGGGDRAAAAAIDLDHALVAGLSAAGRIEDGAIEHDAAASLTASTRARAIALVGVGAVELLSHERCLGW